MEKSKEELINDNEELFEDLTEQVYKLLEIKEYCINMQEIFNDDRKIKEILNHIIFLTKK